MVERAQAAAAAATSLDELRRAQSVLLPALLGATLEQTAAALGIGHATVSRYQRAFRQRPPNLRRRPSRSGAADAIAG